MLTRVTIEEFLDALALRGASKETIRSYRSDLNGALEWLGEDYGATWPQLDDLLSGYLNAKRSEWAPRTLERRRNAFRSWAKHHGHPELLLNYRTPKAGTPQPHPIPEGIMGVLRMIDSTRNPRHKALCVLTGLMGLRVNEAVGVEPHNIDVEGRTLQVYGKGDKVRVVPITETAWEHLRPAYQKARAEGGTLVKLTNHGARAAISRHARKAGIRDHVSSHDMRATFATAAYAATKDLRAVQELLGHADSRTTQVYTGISMDAMRSAAEVA